MAWNTIRIVNSVIHFILYFGVIDVSLIWHIFHKYGKNHCDHHYSDMLIFSAVNITNNIVIILSNDNFMEKEFWVHTTALLFIEIGNLFTNTIAIYYGFKLYSLVKNKMKYSGNTNNRKIHITIAAMNLISGKLKMFILFFYYVFKLNITISWVLLIVVFYIIGMFLAYFGYIYKQYTNSFKENKGYLSDYPGIYKNIV